MSKSISDEKLFELERELKLLKNSKGEWLFSGVTEFHEIAEYILNLIEQREAKAVAVFEENYANELDKISDRLHERARKVLK